MWGSRRGRCRQRTRSNDEVDNEGRADVAEVLIPPQKVNAIRQRSSCIRCDIGLAEYVTTPCHCLVYCQECQRAVRVEAGQVDVDDPLDIPCPLCTVAMDKLERT